MLTALMVMLLNAAGVAPTPEQLQNYELRYQERMHHVHLDFGSTRNGAKQITIGLGYEYHIDRQFNGVSFEVLGQKLGDLFKGPQGWWVGGGIGWWPIRSIKVFMQAGALFEDGETATQGRVGVGYNIPFFMIAIMPHIYVQTTDDGQFSWSIAARIQY